MDKQEILEFMNKNKSCYLATSDGDKPHVRGMMIYRADDKGIIFHTGNMKDVFRQIQANPNVEFCFNNSNPNLEEYIQIRVRGVAALENDAKLKEEIVTERPFLKPIMEEYGDDGVQIFRVQNIVATIWTMATNLAPKKYIELK